MRIMKIIRVYLILSIDQDEGIVLHSIHSYNLIKTEKGFQIALLNYNNLKSLNFENIISPTILFTNTYIIIFT